MNERKPGEVLFDAAVDAAQENTATGLSEIRAHAVYARIKSEMKPRRARWPIFAAIGSTAIAALLYFLLPKQQIEVPPAIAEVVFRSAGVRMEQSDALATQVGTGARMELDEGARVDLDIQGEAKIAVFGPAEIQRAKNGSIGMKKGRASFSVEPHSKESPFVVSAGPDRVVVHGTQFDVHVEEGRIAGVEVQEGRVEVLREGQPPEMLTGGSSKSTSFHAPWWGTVQVDSRGYLFIESDPPGGEVHIDGLVIGSSPLLVRWTAGEAHVSLSLAGYSSWARKIVIEPGKVARLSAQLNGRPLEEIPEPRPRTDPWKTARRLLKAGQCDRLDRAVKQIVRSGDHQENARAEMLGAECQLRRGKKELALERYLSIEKRYRDTPSAEAALFEAANLSADLAKKEALERIELYQARHPEGRFAEAAAIRRCELLVTASRLPTARECLERYRRDHPGGMRANQALLLLATIARIEGRWAEAATAYREYLASSPSSQHAEIAHHHLIECLLRGKLDGADKEIADYLERHPTGARADEVRKWQRARASSR